jgi:hypothetical protein
MSAEQLGNLVQALDLVAERQRAFAELYEPLERALQEQQAVVKRVARLFESRELAARALAQAYGQAKSCVENVKEDALKAAGMVPNMAKPLEEPLNALAEYAAQLEEEYQGQEAACLHEASDLQEEKKEAQLQIKI